MPLPALLSTIRPPHECRLDAKFKAKSESSRIGLPQEGSE